MRTALIFAILSLVSPLGACTTTAQLQAECAANNVRFIDEVSCLSRQVEAEPSLKSDSFITEYILSGKILARKVEIGDIPEDEARLLFARKYNTLLLEQQRYNTLTAVELDALSPRYQDCEIYDGDRLLCRQY